MNHTISAIATANGIGSIAIIRLSGDKALEIIKKLTKKDNFSPRYATLTDIYDQDNQLIDQTIVIHFVAPYSFTGEDVVEIQCHGGFIVAQSILKATLKAGARLATHGEFSKRAFFNGRIDLSEAEAISQLIEAKSEESAKILARQMKGSLKAYIEDIRDRLIHILAYSEVTIDYAEEDLPQDIIESMLEQLDSLSNSLKSTLTASKAREGLMQGFKVAIVGKPNVGKSSLLNALLNYDRAIVSSIAGTTRDTIEEQIKIGTHLIRIVDTAGIRDSTDEIETIGITKSVEAIEDCDIVIALFDSSREFDGEDSEMLKILKEYKNRKKILYVKNKIDLEELLHVDSNIELNFDLEVSSTCSVNSIIEKLEEIMNMSKISDETMLISQRQIIAVEDTNNNIVDALEPLQDQELEIFSFHINEAIKDISSITRPFENDEMLDKMFGSFCLGK